MKNKKLFLFKISQTVNNDWDTYDSAVVVAETPEAAKTIHPDGLTSAIVKNGKFVNKAGDEVFTGTWAHPEKISVQLLGVADGSLTNRQIICASFHAG